MNKGMYTDIVGISAFLEYFPSTHWCHFQKLLDFRWYRDFDCEEWCDRFCVELTVSDLEDKDIILLKLKNARGKCEFSGQISGLEIVNLKYGGTYFETNYEVLDYEESQIHFYCDDIEIAILSVNGKNIE